jgi:galactokinase
MVHDIPSARASSARSPQAAAAGEFRRLTGVEPEGVWVAPARVNLIGEHTDYNGGLVLPIAVDRSAILAARRRDDDVVRVVSLQVKGEVSASLTDIEPGRIDGWAAYPLGTLWALHEAGLDVQGLDLVFDSDIPLGGGLASSAALEVATALAVTELTAQQMDVLDLARACQAGENAVAGAPTGIMDQLTSLSGRAGHALLIDCRTLSTELIAWRPEDTSLVLLVIDTTVRHANSGAGYRARREQCTQAAAALGVETLRDATAASVATTLVGVLRGRAAHVVSENQRVADAAELLRAGRLPNVGPLFDASHASLRDDYEVSCAELDVAVQTARAAGALGARMTGAGFGGCAIALIHAAETDAVSTAVSAAFAQRGYRPPRIFALVTADGACRVA